MQILEILDVYSTHNIYTAVYTDAFFEKQKQKSSTMTLNSNNANNATMQHMI